MCSEASCGIKELPARAAAVELFFHAHHSEFNGIPACFFQAEETRGRTVCESGEERLTGAVIDVFFTALIHLEPLFEPFEYNACDPLFFGDIGYLFYMHELLLSEKGR